MLPMHRGQWRLFCLFMSPALWSILRKRPRIVFKHLHKYLYASFARDARLTALLHHHAFLLARTRPGFFNDLVHRPPVLWQRACGDKMLAITLAFPTPNDQEGDLGLVAWLGAQRIFIVSFSIVPSACLGQPDGPALFIGRVQGLADTERMRETTRLCGDVAPGSLLMAAVTGFASALGINRMYGVSALDQLSRDDGRAERGIGFDYDGFWGVQKGEPISPHFFYLETPLRHRPLETVAANHRKRTLLKRNFKDGVAAGVAQTVRDELLC